MRVLLMGLFMCLACSFARAELGTWSNERHLFLEAEAAYQRGDLTTYETLYSQLDGYPLQPYLRASRLESELAQTPPAQILEYIARWGESPLGRKMRSRWLAHLASQARWNEFVRHYEPTENTKLRCAYADALIATGQADSAWPLIESLWLVGRSQPDDCDSAFRRWREAGLLTGNLVWQRLGLSVQSGNSSMVRYLQKLLGPEPRELANLWLEVRENPEVVISVKRFPDTDAGREILLWGLRRLARNDPHRAADVWRSVRKNREFHEWETGTIDRRIGLSFAREHQAEGFDWLSRLPATFSNEQTREWLLLSALRLQKWPQVLDLIDQLPGAQKDERRWIYWQARALESQGLHAKADKLYKQLAQSRSYYGFLAADRIDLPYQFHHAPLEPDPSVLESVKTDPAIQRAHELYRLSRYAQARREWQFALVDWNGEQIAAAAKLAQSWQWHARAIFTVALAKKFNDLVLRFPLAHRDAFMSVAKNQQLDPAWLYAVARQESAFIADVKSSAGALGLMQIMPATGRYIAKNLGDTNFKTRDLLSPVRNIEFASWYLKDLFSDLNQHIALSSAGYNAGPHRVKRWLPKTQALPADIWIETIPFKETRGYVRRVLEYKAVYEMRLGRPQSRLSDSLTPVPSTLN